MSIFKDVIITGDRGYIGSAVRAALESDPTYTREGTRFYYFDSADPMEQWLNQWHNFIRDVPKCSLILHIGANANSESDDLSIFDLNYEATKHIVDYARTKHARLVFLSSCQARCPMNLYGLSKRHAEDYISHAMPAGDAVILRVFNVFGREGSRSGAKSIPQKIVDGDLAAVFEGCRRDFIHVDDVARMILTFLFSPQWDATANPMMPFTGRQRVYDVGRSQGISVEDLAKTAKRSFPHKCLPPNIAESLVASRSRLILGVNPDSFRCVHQWIKEKTKQELLTEDLGA